MQKFAENLLCLFEEKRVCHKRVKGAVLHTDAGSALRPLRFDTTFLHNGAAVAESDVEGTPVALRFNAGSAHLERE